MLELSNEKFFSEFHLKSFKTVFCKTNSAAKKRKMRGDDRKEMISSDKVTNRVLSSALTAAQNKLERWALDNFSG
jgi:hypothetical protein